MSAERGDPFDIPAFLRLTQDERKAAWEQHRKIAKPLPAVPETDWRQERNRAYDEAARKDQSSGSHGPKS